MVLNTLLLTQPDFLIQVIRPTAISRQELLALAITQKVQQCQTERAFLLHQTVILDFMMPELEQVSTLEKTGTQTVLWILLHRLQEDLHPAQVDNGT